MTSKNPSFRRFVIALGVASVAATISGAWFLKPDAGEPSAADARVRLAVWDVYQKAWSYRYLEVGQVLRGAEGDIIELRPEVVGDALSSVPAFIETISLPTGVTTPSESPTTPVQVPGGPVPLPPGSWDAHGTPVYGRLKVSTTEYTAGPFTYLIENPNYDPIDDPVEDLEIIGPAPSPFDPGTAAGEVPSPEEWDLKALDVNGSVGIQSVELSVGADTLAFTWDVSRWAKGDVFLGLNDASYKILDRDGNFKRYIATAEYRRLNQYDGDAAPITTGCAANWHTGEVYMTNFSNFEPAVNVTLRHPGSEDLPYSGGMSRRLSTAIFRSEDLPAQALGEYVYPIDGSPESVAFDGNQNLYVGHSFPHYGTLSDSIVDPNYVAIELGGVILYVDELGALLLDGLGNPTAAQTRPLGSAAPYAEVTDGAMSIRLDMDSGGNLIFSTKDFNWSGLGLLGPADERVTGLRQPNAYWEDAASGLFLETELAPNVPFAARRPLGKRLHRYNNLNGPLVDPAYAPTARDIFWTFTSRQGTDWIDLSSDQRTMFYTSENSYIHRYDTVTGEQLPDFGTGPSRQLGQPLERFHAMRILPPGDGSGGVLVAAGTAILRLNADGVVVQQYQAVGDPDVILWQPYSSGGLVQVWYSLEIDPSGRTFWASGHDTGYIYQFDLATGDQLQRKPAVDFRPLGHEDAPNGRRVEGICIMWEYTAAQEVCGDGIDNDNDGFIDESCTAIESCDARSPGDDDGDGLEDHNDPDCGDEQPPTAVADQYVTNQGVALDVPANGVLANDTDPDNTDGDPYNDDVLTVGTMGTNVLTLNAANVGVAFPTAQGGSVTLSASGGFIYTPAPGFHGLDTFMYQAFDGAATSNEALVEIRVRPLVADDSYTMLQKGTLSVGGLDGSPDPDGILVNDSTQPMFVAAADAGPGVTPFLFFKNIITAAGGSVVIFESGDFVYQPLPAYVGLDSFVYQGKDAASDSSNTATVTITVEDVNELVAVNDVATTPHGTPVVVNVRTNDVDPEGHTFSVIAINGTPISTGGSVAIVNGGGTGTVTLNADGNLVVTPNIGYSGLVTFTYTVEDTPVAPMLAVTSTARVDVTVGAPSISGTQDDYTTPQNTLLSVASNPGDPLGVLANDHGAAPLAVYAAGNSSSMTVSGGGWVTLVTDGGGAVTIRGDGGFTYMPLPLFVGVDKFLYRLIDTQGTPSAVVAVFITVTPTSSVAVATTPNPSVYGTATPITATVRCGASLTPSAGTVTFSQGAITLATDVPVVNGIASTSFPASLEVGNYPVTADYSGAVNQCPVGSGSTSHQVTPAPLVVTADPQSKAYGTMFTFGGTEVTAGGLLFATDTVTGATLTSAGAAPTATVVGGPYGITPSAAVGTRLNNYTIEYVDGPLTVNPVPLVITADDRSKVYGTATTFEGTEFTAPGLLNGDLVASVSLSSTGAPASASANATYPIVPVNATGTGLDNYLVGYANGTLTVTQKVLTVTALDRTKPYGTLAQFAGTEFSVSGLILGDSVTAVTLTSVGGVETAGVAGGPYPIVAAGAVGSGIENYTVEYVAGSLDVSPAPLTVTADAQSRVYGATFTFGGTEVTTAGLLFATDTVTAATLTSAGVAPIATVAGSPYDITPSAAVGTGLTNYTIEYVNGPLTVTPRPLTVTADDRSKVYGTTATFVGTEFSASGLVNGDLVTSVSLSSTGAPASASAYATYPIVPVDATGTGLDNYLVGYADGTLTVTPRMLTVTALDRTKPYGTLAQFAGTEFSVSGLILGDSVTAVTLTSVGGVETAGVAGGPYPIVAVGAVGSGIENYAVQYVAGNLAVSPAPLTVTANAQSKAYGTTFTFVGTEITTAGLLFSTDTVTSATLTSAGAAATATVAGSPFGITPSAAVGTGLTNYAIEYVNGPLTVNPVPLTITADNRSKVYGTTATFAGTEFSALGLLNGDLVTAVSLSSTGAPAPTPANTTHPIVPAAAVGPSLSNYVVAYVDGTLTVTPASLTVTATDKTKVEGTPNPVLDGTGVGLVAGDNITWTYDTTATLTSPAGTYPITPSISDPDGLLSNYTVTLVDGTLTVTSSEPPCSAVTMAFSGNSSTSGAAGNIRSFSTGGVAVKASAFSRTKSGGTWATAYLGIWSVGMGVTDGSEGSGGNNTHKVDNGGARLNYILFEFSQPVVVTKAYLDSIGADSDATVWVGTQTNPYTNHLMLSDALLSSLGGAQVSDGGSGARWATFNGSQVSGNVLVIAAKTTDSDDAFKVSKLYVACAPPLANRPPDAVDDVRSTQGTTPVSIPVLANDTDPDGDTLTVVSTGYTQPANGTVTLSGGVFTFVATAGFTGTTTFTYTISDGHGGTDVATVTITVRGAEVCYVGTRAPQLGANQTWWTNSDGTVTIRTTVSRNFNDNTYGTNQIGWPGNNHKFNHLVTSDMIQIALYDNSGARKLEMKLDYFSASSSFPSGYGSRGPFGGDGAMVVGSLSQVTGADSSLARNFNQFGYQLTSNSPATSSSYATNATYPNWIWDVYYDVTVKASAFGASGFGYPRIVTMHASPSKTGVETEPLAVTECGDAGDPGRNGAPVAVSNTYTTAKATVLTVGGTGLLGNDSDPDEDELTVVRVNGSTSSVGQSIRLAHGYVKVKADGTFTYTPDSTYVGTETFTYQVTDGALTSAPATVTITISSHYDGDGCDHDRGRGDHHHGDNCGHDRDCDNDDDRDGHYRGDDCDHDRGKRGHRAGDNCDHDRDSRRDDDHSHQDGDRCDHDRDRNGHKKGDNCDHDRDSRRDRD